MIGLGENKAKNNNNVVNEEETIQTIKYVNIS